MKLDERMKFYEGQHRLMPLIPVAVRLDGKAFHTFTQGLDKPYDYKLMDLMIETTKFLVDETNARIGYTQSDEISLILMADNFESQIYFDGKVNKLNSILASKCSVFFNKNLPKFLPDKIDCDPVFDCRCFNLPTKVEAVNLLVWREQDAVRNSIQMAGQAEFSHNALMHMSCDNIQEMLWNERNINWNNYPTKAKRGTYVQRRKVLRGFSTEELAVLPPKHEAHTNPDLKIERSETIVLDMPIITQVVNICGVVFAGDRPLIE